MTRPRFIVAVAALAAIAAGGFGTFHSAGATGSFTRLVYSTNPIATAGTLTTSSGPITFTVTAYNGTATVSGATVYLAFNHVGLAPGGSVGGAATATDTTQTNITLTATPAPFVTSGTGTISITYTPSVGPVPTSGHDAVTAEDGATALTSTVSRNDNYSFSTLASYVWSDGATIAPTGTLTAGQVVTFTVTAESSTSAPVPSGQVYLSLTTTASSGGSATATDANGTSAVTSAVTRFVADNNGVVTVSYRAPTTLPSGGTDTLRAQDHSNSTLITATTTYTFSTTSPPPPTFAAHNVGAPQVAVTPDGSTQLVFWKDSASNQLTEAWYTGAWNGPMAFPQLGALTSAPGVAVTKDGTTQLVFWDGPGGHLFEAWYTGVWNGPLDITTTYLGGHGILASAPSVTTTTDGTQLVFWRGTDGHLGEAWYSNGWHGPTEPALGSLASAPSSTISADGSTQLVFFQGTDNHLTEDWFAGGAWHGPMERGPTNSSPSIAVTPDGSTQLVFYQGPGGHLFEDWYTGAWNGPVDFTTTAFGGVGPLTSPPSATVTVDGSTQLVFWQGAGNTLWEGWYAGGAWHGPVDWSAA